MYVPPLHLSPSLSSPLPPLPLSLLSSPSCRQTAQCKLQQELLECVGHLALRLHVTSADLERLAHASLLYLHSDQPDVLQQACQTCFRNLIDLDPDAMWLVLAQLISEGGKTTPPSSSLKPYVLPSCSDRDKYIVNVCILMNGTNIT